MTYTEVEQEIIEVLRASYINDTDDIIALLDEASLENYEIAEIILKAWQAGRVNGKETIKKQIAILR